MSLVERVERFGSHDGKLVSIHDLAALVERLKSVEQEFRRVEGGIAAAVANREVVAKPGFKPKLKSEKQA